MIMEPWTSAGPLGPLAFPSLLSGDAAALKNRVNEDASSVLAEPPAAIRPSQKYL